MKAQLTNQEAADGSEYSSLTVGRVYEVLGIEGDWLRLLNDNGEPVLYDPQCFRVVDSTEPANWVSVVEDGATYAYPPPLLLCQHVRSASAADTAELGVRKSRDRPSRGSHGPSRTAFRSCLPVSDWVSRFGLFKRQLGCAQPTQYRRSKG